MARFDSEKKRTLEDYSVALKNQKIDLRIIPILDIINTHKDYYTTSSCSGRIFLLALASPGAKNQSSILDKWHDKVSLNQIKRAIQSWKEYKYLYFLAQSPIFHVISRDLKSAVRLRNLGEKSGFKYSSIRSIKPIKHDETVEDESKEIEIDISDDLDYSLNARITVELLSTERLNIPIGVEGKVFIDDKYLEFLVNLANTSISDSNSKLTSLEKILKIELAVSDPH